MPSKIKISLSFVILKILTVLVFIVIMPPLFEQSIFKFNDLGYYSSGDLGIGPNISYRWLIWLLGINNIYEPLPIFLASILNIGVDIAWIYLVSKHLNYKGTFLFALMLGIQPYAAVYTMKFTTIIFAKIGLFFFCRELFNEGLNRVNKKTLTLGELSFWTLITSLRNSNLFIAAPYLFLKLRNKPVIAILVSLGFVLSFYFLSLGYLVGLDPSSRPWSLNYTKELLGLNNNFIALPVLFIARILLLFGAREKLYGEGIEPFFVWGTPGLELCIYILLGLIQFFGFYIAMRFLFKKYGFISLVLLIPLFLAILTVAHQRYLIPFIPISLFGIALVFDKKILGSHD
tara:strand:+ start:2881 stop:3915 length:1035 start_codon:yes stop_codon:yes gene_type:complete